MQYALKILVRTFYDLNGHPHGCAIGVTFVQSLYRGRVIRGSFFCAPATISHTGPVEVFIGSQYPRMRGDDVHRL